MPDTDTPTAGKREQTKAQNRQAILHAARAVFGELGYGAATVRDIIRRAGLGSGTFYNYYRSKGEVFAALADEGNRRFDPILRALRAEGHDFETFAPLAIHAYFEFLAQEHHNWRARHPPGDPTLHVQGETPEMAAVFAEVRAALADAIAGRDGGTADLDYMATACIAIAREVGDRMLHREPIDTQSAADFAVAMILRGLYGVPGATL